MSLIPQETLARDFWLHKCEAKEGSNVYTEKGKACPYCSTPEPKPTK